MTHQRWFLGLGAALGGIAVALGAVGAHVLKLNGSNASPWGIAEQYQFVHALGLIGIGLLMNQIRGNLWIKISGWTMFLATLLFCGSLDLFVAVGEGPWEFVTPIGGSLLIVSWCLLVIGVLLPTQ